MCLAEVFHNKCSVEKTLKSWLQLCTFVCIMTGRKWANTVLYTIFFKGRCQVDFLTSLTIFLVGYTFLNDFLYLFGADSPVGNVHW